MLRRIMHVRAHTTLRGSSLLGVYLGGGHSVLAAADKICRDLTGWTRHAIQQADYRTKLTMSGSRDRIDLKVNLQTRGAHHEMHLEE